MLIEVYNGALSRQRHGSMSIRDLMTGQQHTDLSVLDRAYLDDTRPSPKRYKRKVCIYCAVPGWAIQEAKTSEL